MDVPKPLPFPKNRYRKTPPGFKSAISPFVRYYSDTPLQNNEFKHVWHVGSLVLFGRIPNARLALVGTGPDADALKDHFAGIKTVLTGVMTGEALSQAFASADVFVMPSDSETLGFVVLESIASGVPVVGADAGGIPDLIAHGEVGGAFPCLHYLCARVLSHASTF